ncbi:MAG: zf-TFIIB domain-containing protein [Chloroflexota bacterium]
MFCPVCVDEMLVMSERNGIEIDYCPRCRGVWLDRGELDKIIERAAGFTPQPTRTAPPPPDRKRKNDDPQPMGFPSQRDDYRAPRYDDRRRESRSKRLTDFLEDVFEILD